MSTSALAACTETASGSGVWICSGAETTTQSPTSAPGGATMVTTLPGFSVDTTPAGGDAIFIQNFPADTDVSFTDTNASTITAHQEGIDINNDGTGDTTVLTNSVIIAGSDGILVDREDNGGSVVVNSSGAITAGDEGIVVEHDGNGSVSVTSSGAIDAGDQGLVVYTDDTATFVTVTTNAVVDGDDIGVRVDHEGSGAVSVTTNGAVVGTDEYGIIVETYESTEITLTANDDVTSNGTGIYVDNYGYGETEVTISGNVTGSGTDGISIRNRYTAGDITLSAADVTGGGSGLSEAIEITQDNTIGTVDVSVTGDLRTGAGAPNGLAIASEGGDISVDVVNILGIGAADGPDDGIDIDGENGAANITVITRGTVDVTEAGIKVEQDGTTGTGNISVTTLGAILADTEEGIVVETANDGDIDIIVQSGITAGEEGILAESDGAGDISITASAAVTGGEEGVQAVHSGSGGVDVTLSNVVTGGTGAAVSTSTSLGADVAITLNSGASLSSTSGAAILDTLGDATLDLNAGAVATGTIILGDGSDIVNVNGGDVSGVTLFDGGDDLATGDGFVDALRFTSTSLSIAGANVTDWETVHIGAGSDFIFTDNALSAGILEIAATGTLNTGGGFALTGAMLHSGTIASQNGSAGDVISVSGDFTGGGVLQFDVDLASDTSDRLLVGGNTSGSTAISFSDVSGGPATGNDVLVVDVTGTTAAGHFTLDGGAFASGPYLYDLGLVGSQWFLLAGPLGDTDGVYEVTPAILLGFGDMPTLEQRLGDRRRLGSGNVRCQCPPQKGPWVRVFGDRQDLDSGGSTVPLTGQGASRGVQAGIDLAAERGDHGLWVFGLTAQIGQAEADVVTTTATGTLDASGFGLGGTATYYGDDGGYADLQFQVNWIDSDFISSATGNVASGRNSTAYAISLEGGRRIALDKSRDLIPQAQLIFEGWSGGAFTDGNGTVVNFGKETRLTGRLGLAYEFECRDGCFSHGLASKSRKDRLSRKAYVIGNVLHEFSGPTRVNVGGTDLIYRPSKTWAEIGFGGSINRGTSSTIYGEATYRRALDGGRNNGLSATFGVQWTW